MRPRMRSPVLLVAFVLALAAAAFGQNINQNMVVINLDDGGYPRGPAPYVVGSSPDVSSYLTPYVVTSSTYQVVASPVIEYNTYVMAPSYGHYPSYAPAYPSYGYGFGCGSPFVSCLYSRYSGNYSYSGYGYGTSYPYARSRTHQRTTRTHWQYGQHRRW